MHQLFIVISGATTRTNNLSRYGVLNNPYTLRLLLVGSEQSTEPLLSYHGGYGILSLALHGAGG